MCCCTKKVDFLDNMNEGLIADSGETRVHDIDFSNGYAIWKANGAQYQHLSWGQLKEANGIVTVDGIKLNNDGAWSFKLGFNLVGNYGTCNGWGIRIQSGSEISIFEISNNGLVEDPKIFVPATELSDNATLVVLVKKDTIEAYLSATGWNNVYSATHTVANRSNKGAKGLGIQLSGYNNGNNGTVGKISMQYRDLYV